MKYANWLAATSLFLLAVPALSQELREPIQESLSDVTVQRIVLRPSVRFSGEGPNQEELRKLHEKAHRGCFIASSINTEVRIEPPSV